MNHSAEQGITLTVQVEPKDIDLFNKLFRNGGKCLVSIPYQI